MKCDIVKVTEMEGQPPPNYKDIAAAALARRAAVIPKKYLIPEDALKNLPKDLTKTPAIITHYTVREHEIISAEVESILEKIRDRIWTAVEVTEAFCKAATVANQLVYHLVLKIGARTMLICNVADKLPNRGPLPRSPSSSYLS
jgi:hypothetical protein